MKDPVLEVTMRVRLRDYSDPENSRPLPSDITLAAMFDTARRLAVHQEGGLVTTTMFRVPGDPDSDCVEDVGGGWRVVGVALVGEAQRVTEAESGTFDAHAVLDRAGVHRFDAADATRKLDLTERVELLAAAYKVRKSMHDELLSAGLRVKELADRRR